MKASQTKRGKSRQTDLSAQVALMERPAHSFRFRWILRWWLPLVSAAILSLASVPGAAILNWTGFLHRLQVSRHEIIQSLHLQFNFPLDKVGRHFLENNNTTTGEQEAAPRPWHPFWVWKVGGGGCLSWNVNHKLSSFQETWAQKVAFLRESQQHFQFSANHSTEFNFWNKFCSSFIFHMRPITAGFYDFGCIIHLFVWFFLCPR